MNPFLFDEDGASGHTDGYFDAQEKQFAEALR
jgi:hypothetical protein